MKVSIASMHSRSPSAVSSSDHLPVGRPGEDHRRGPGHLVRGGLPGVRDGRHARLALRLGRDRRGHRLQAHPRLVGRPRRQRGAMTFIGYLVPLGQIAIGICLILGLFTVRRGDGHVMMLIFFVAAWDFQFGIVNQHLTYAVMTFGLAVLAPGTTTASTRRSGRGQRWRPALALLGLRRRRLEGRDRLTAPVRVSPGRRAPRDPAGPGPGGVAPCLRHANRPATRTVVGLAGAPYTRPPVARRSVRPPAQPRPRPSRTRSRGSRRPSPPGSVMPSLRPRGAGGGLGGDRPRRPRPPPRPDGQRQDAGRLPLGHRSARSIARAAAHGGRGCVRADPVREPAQGPDLRRGAEPAGPAGRDRPGGTAPGHARAGRLHRLADRRHALG